MPSRLHPDFRKFPAEPLAVRIQICARGKFASDRDNFRFARSGGICGGHVCLGVGPFSLESV